MDTKSSASDQAPTPYNQKYYCRISYTFDVGHGSCDFTSSVPLDTFARLAEAEAHIAAKADERGLRPANPRIVNLIPLKG